MKREPKVDPNVIVRKDAEHVVLNADEALEVQNQFRKQNMVEKLKKIKEIKK
tara:strand:- start:69 stop:224 length:156 start_codon:yes stop_codon:yes gene_type:complete